MLDEEGAGFPEFTYLAKAAYVNGLLDGRLYDYLKLWPADQALADSLFSDDFQISPTSEIVRALDISTAIVSIGTFPSRQLLYM